MSAIDQQLMTAYLDGRQTAAEIAAFEARLAAEPALARRYAALLLMDLQLRSALMPARQKKATSRFTQRMTHAALLAAALLVGLNIWGWPGRSAIMHEPTEILTIEVPDAQVHDLSVDGGPLLSRGVHVGQTVRAQVPVTLRWTNEATSVVVTPLAGQATVQIIERGLALNGGKLEAQVAPRDRSQAFHIVAGDSVATVIGTHFRITRDARETNLQVISGRVEFRHQGQVQMVEAGEEASTNRLADRGLIAHWSGESLVGNRLNNLAPGGQVGEAKGLRAVPGLHGQALHFSGNESLAAIAHNPACDLGDPAQPFTIAVWLRLKKDDRREQTIFGKGRNLTTPGPTLAVVLEVSAGDHVDLYRWHDAEPHADRKMEVSGWTAPHLADGEWHHVVVVAEHASLRRCYYDGVEVGTDTRTWHHDTRNLSRLTLGRIENMGYTEEFPFSGDLKDLRLYNRAVTAGEVTALFSGRP